MRQAISNWAVVVGILLVAMQLGGCSADKQPATEPADPLAEPADPPFQQTPSPTPELGTELPAAAELPGQSATTPSDQTTLPPDEESQRDDSPPLSLQHALDNEPPPVDGETMLAELGYVSPADKVRQQLADPPGTTRLSQQSSLWVDVKGKRVFVDGYVAQREAYLEMFACPAETKEHESVVGVMAQSSELHAALLAVGAVQGATVRYDPEYIPATGQRIRIWVMWYDEGGKFQHTDARRWVRHVGTEDSLKLDWVFAGSTLWKDPSDGKEYYQADGGEMICVSNFSTALMDLPVESSDANNELQFDAFTERIPPPGTPVRLMLVPIASDSDPAVDNDSATVTAPLPDQPPTAELMPLKQPAKA